MLSNETIDHFPPPPTPPKCKTIEAESKKNERNFPGALRKNTRRTVNDTMEDIMNMKLM